MPSLVSLILAVVYLFLVLPRATRILWHDELFTYYIAKFPTLEQFVQAISRVDLNPPMSYAVARLSLVVFGDSEIAIRLPFMLAFFIGSIGLLHFVSRRAGALWASVAVSLLWGSGFLYYATEARPYALLLAFFSITLLSYDVAVDGLERERKLALAGIAIGNTGMMLSHVFAPFSVMPFFLAEVIRLNQRRKPDWALWATLLFPFSAMIIYIGFVYFPLVRRFEGVAFPAAFQASWQKVLLFYLRVMIPICGALVAGFLAATFAIELLRSGHSGKLPPGCRRVVFRVGDIGLITGLLLPPVLLNLLMAQSHGAFWDRYSITTAVAIYAMVALFLARRATWNTLATAVFAATVLIVAVSQSKFVGIQHIRRADSLTLDRISPNLPFVAASGLTFLEMDHYESADFLTRVYYLTDRESALQYAHATIFEGLTALKQYFPIRANISGYQVFAARHRQFLVLGTIDYPEDWLLRKLQHEGAQLRTVGTFSLPYKDSTVYEVTLPIRSPP